MKRFYIVIAFIGLALGAKAQDQAIFTQYYVSPVLINPAVAGFQDNQNFQFHFRNQWTGFPGSPVTFGAVYHGAIGKTLGVGANVMSENIGSLNRLRLQLNYAFRYKIGGVKVGMGFSTDFSNASVRNSVTSNPYFEPDDQILQEVLDGENVFDASLGFYASFRDQTFLGLSFPNLIVTKISDIQSGDPEGSFFGYVIFQAGHKFRSTNTNLTVEPSIMMRSLLNVPFQTDFNLKMGFLNERLITGLSYRAGTGGALGILLGTDVETFRIFYSYDVSFQRFQQYNSGSHEVTLAFRFGGPDNPHPIPGH